MKVKEILSKSGVAPDLFLTAYINMFQTAAFAMDIEADGYEMITF